MSFCIMRHAKLKTIGNFAASVDHNLRLRITPNARPELSHLNEITGAEDKPEMMAALKSKLDEVETIRKNAVLAVEYFIGASPEFFKDAPIEDQKNYFKLAENWLKEVHGAENVIACGVHYDETTPHMWAYVVPIDEKGKLNASKFLDGPAKLRRMQTEFAEFVGKPVGLERGLEGSTAQHVDVSKFYGAINAPLPEVKTKVPPVPEPTFRETISEKMGLETAHSRAAAAAAEAKAKRQDEKIERQNGLEAKAKYAEVARRARDEKSEKLAELKDTANFVRGIPLEDVLKRLGCETDPADKKNWKTPAGRITVNGAKFYNHDLQSGGGGAIDLVKHIEGLDYKGAVSWLAGEAPRSAVISAVVEKARQEAAAIIDGPKKKLEPPAPDQSKWPRVKDYLVKIRAIKESIVDGLHDAGRLYADRFANAVFLSRDGKSCQMRGTGEKPFHGIRGEHKSWIWTHPDTTEVKQIIAVESAIDGLSYAEIHGFNAGDRIISMGGSAGDALRSLAASAMKAGAKVVAAFDRDGEGDRMAKVLKETGVEYERKTPVRKDWNADLQEMKNPEMQPPKPKKSRNFDLGR